MRCAQTSVNRLLRPPSGVLHLLFPLSKKRHRGHLSYGVVHRARPRAIGGRSRAPRTMVGTQDSTRKGVESSSPCSLPQHTRSRTRIAVRTPPVRRPAITSLLVTCCSRALGFAHLLLPAIRGPPVRALLFANSALRRTCSSHLLFAYFVFADHNLGSASPLLTFQQRALCRRRHLLQQPHFASRWGSRPRVTRTAGAARRGNRQPTDMVHGVRAKAFWSCDAMRCDAMRCAANYG